MEEKHCKNFSEIRKGPGLNENQTKDVLKHQQGSNEVAFAFTK